MANKNLETELLIVHEKANKMIKLSDEVLKEIDRMTDEYSLDEIECHRNSTKKLDQKLRKIRDNLIELVGC